MDNILSSIDEIYSEILKTKSLVLEQAKKLHFFGGANCKMGGGPEGHASFNPKSWMVNRAWDIMGSEGTSVYSLDNGKISSVQLKNYNPQTKEYGYSIVIDTEGDKIYYTHLSSVGPLVRQGEKISQGDLLGKIGKPKEDPNWPSHVHVAIERGNLNTLMDGFCNITSKKGTSTSTGNTSSDSGTTGNDSEMYYGSQSFADLVVGNKFNSLTEATMMAPVPIKPGFKGNFNQVRKNGYIHPGTDIPIPSGTQVKAPLAGKVVGIKSNQHPCGGTIDIQYSDGFWSRFCHMKQINVKEGDMVNRGDVVGLSGGGANDYGRGRSSGPHLHFTLKKDGKKVDPAHYMEKFNASDITYDSDVKSTNSSDPDSIEGEVDSSGTNALKSIFSNSEPELFYGNKEFANLLSKSIDFEMKEEKVYGEFGKSQQSRYGSITLPKEKNDKIKSPISGKIIKGKYNPSCINQISILHEIDEKEFVLEYCNISNVRVRNGENVSKGTVLGHTKDDVVVSLFDKTDSRVYIDNYINKEINKTKKLKSKGIDSEPKIYYDSPWGRILGNIIASPIRWFEDKYNESGELKQKRWSSPTEKEQPDDWISQGSPTHSKRLKEQIEKIKKIL